MTAVATEPRHLRAETVRAGVGFGQVLRWETRKLAAQWRARAVLLGALLLPIPVVVVMHGQSRPPKDTLFGRYALDNGFAMSLLVLGFAAQWVLPLLTAIVAGDIFASEDQHGTWKTVLTRSTSRTRLFWAKTVVAIGFALAVLAVLATTTIVASLVVVGHQPLTGLSGQPIASAEALRLVVASWASMAAPMIAFTCLALLLSAWSRSPAVGIAAPVVLGLVMQLLGALGGIEAVRPFLLSTAMESWHGFFAAPRFLNPWAEGVAVCGLWCLACLTAAFVVFRRRDITGG